MSKPNATVNSNLPRMIVRERTEANTTIPPLPVMPEEFRYGGEWMDPQWKKDVRTGKKLFTGYPIHMAIILVLTAALAAGLALASKGTAPKDDVIDYPSDGYYEDIDDKDAGGTEYDGSQTAEDDNTGSGAFVAPTSDGIERITGYVDDAYIEIFDYNLWEDEYGQKYIVISLDETNMGSSDYPASGFYEVYAEQDGYELTHVTGGMDVYGEQFLADLGPGETRQIHLFFRGVNFDGGPAIVELYNFFNEDEYVGIEAQMYDPY